MFICLCPRLLWLICPSLNVCVSVLFRPSVFPAQQQCDNTTINTNTENIYNRGGTNTLICCCLINIPDFVVSMSGRKKGKGGAPKGNSYLFEFLHESASPIAIEMPYNFATVSLLTGEMDGHYNAVLCTRSQQASIDGFFIIENPEKYEKVKEMRQCDGLFASLLQTFGTRVDADPNDIRAFRISPGICELNRLLYASRAFIQAKGGQIDNPVVDAFLGRQQLKGKQLPIPDELAAPGGSQAPDKILSLIHLSEVFTPRYSLGMIEQFNKVTGNLCLFRPEAATVLYDPLGLRRFGHWEMGRPTQASVIAELASLPSAPVLAETIKRLASTSRLGPLYLHVAEEFAHRMSTGGKDGTLALNDMLKTSMVKFSSSFNYQYKIGGIAACVNRLAAAVVTGTIPVEPVPALTDIRPIQGKHKSVARAKVVAETNQQIEANFRALEEFCIRLSGEVEKRIHTKRFIEDGCVLMKAQLERLGIVNVKIVSAFDDWRSSDAQIAAQKILAFFGPKKGRDGTYDAGIVNIVGRILGIGIKNQHKDVEPPP